MTLILIYVREPIFDVVPNGNASLKHLQKFFFNKSIGEGSRGS